MKPDRLSELVPGALPDILARVGTNERLIVEVLKEKGVNAIAVSRQTNITFWQAFAATTWFPILVAIVSIVLWKFDTNKVVVHYVRDNLAVTMTGLFAGWIVAMGAIAFFFRYIRRS